MNEHSFSTNTQRQEYSFWKALWEFWWLDIFCCPNMFSLVRKWYWLNETLFILGTKTSAYNIQSMLVFYSLEQPLERVEQSASKLSIWTRAWLWCGVCLSITISTTLILPSAWSSIADGSLPAPTGSIKCITQKRDLIKEATEVRTSLSKIVPLLSMPPWNLPLITPCSIYQSCLR